MSRVFLIEIQGYFFWVVAHLILFLQHVQDVAGLSYWNSYALANQSRTGVCVCRLFRRLLFWPSYMLPSKFSVLVDLFCRPSHQPTSDENNLATLKVKLFDKALRCVDRAVFLIKRDWLQVTPCLSLVRLSYETNMGKTSSMWALLLLVPCVLAGLSHSISREIGL
jgi:hypothetical protein